MLLAGTRAELGDLQGAHELNELVHAARQRLLPEDHPDLLAIKLNLATTRKALGDLQGAHELNEQAHSAWQRLLPTDHLDLLIAKQNLAGTCYSLGDLQGAQELFEDVHAARVRLLSADHPDLLTAKEGLAIVRYDLGDLRGAQELLEAVYTSRQRFLDADHPDLLEAKSRLAATHSALGDLQGALELFEAVHDARTRLLSPDHPDLLSAKHNLAVARESLGDLQGALELEEAVLVARLRLLSPDHPDLLSAKLNLASTREALGDLQGALDLKEAVLSARQQLLPVDHPDLLRAKGNLVLTRYSVGDLTGAYELSAALLQGQILVAARLHSEAPRVARAGAYQEFPQLASALFLSESAPADAKQQNLPNLDPLIFSALESLRSISVSSPEVALAARADPELATLRDSIAQVRQQVSQTSAAPPEAEAAMEAWRAHLFALSEDRDQLQAELRESLALRGLEFRVVTAEAIANQLGEDSAVVSFFRYKRLFDDGRSVDSLLAFIVTPDARLRRVELGAALELEKLVSVWRTSLGAAPGRGIGIGISDMKGDGSGEQLRLQILDPCLAVIGDSPPSQLHLILDDFLHLIPFDALQAKNGRPLGESLRIVVESSMRRLMRAQPSAPTSGTLLALGEVDYEASVVENLGFQLAAARPPQSSDRGGAATSFPALPETRAEVETLAKLLKVDKPVVLLGDAATKRVLVEQAPHARYLHIATHGWFAPPEFKSTLETAELEPVSVLSTFTRAENTLRGFAPETLCGLALAGANHGRDKNGHVPGIITAEELSTLDLSNCELAVLSACETNVGLRRAGQGIQSLQTALHAAGARTAITSLWNVDDAATRRLMELFYTKLWSEKLGKADALWQAKMILHSEGHGPRDWAGWVLTGTPE